MGVELTQWTLVKPGRLGAPSRAADDSIWLKAPSGEMQRLPLASLTPEVRSFVAELASGSKVPKEILGDILAAREVAASAERAAERPWTLHHVDIADGLYVFLNPPPVRGARPVAFSLERLAPAQRLELELAAPGDAVPEDIIAALRGESAASLPGAEPGGRADRPPHR
ncbi:MAG TPA: hypothetical protein VN811_17510 [Thermoanaerobaculia bacterium]|nr:hypothetical protein [Thermoanaerobaculia bacterium]HXT52842.1 hypothetical protein [Thermoanaerobaculia bacterium]